jgi:RHS repeat-associated protein
LEVNRLGLLANRQYLNESPKYTPDVQFSYDRMGNRLGMSEYNGATLVRSAAYSYDHMNRLMQAAFDRDGNGAIDETVKYDYDAAGLRTKLTLPDGKTVSYSYDTRGRLTSLTDWASQTATYGYDGVDRQASRSANGISTTLTHDAAGRLTLLKHLNGGSTLTEFGYTVDARGNRTQAYERLAKSGGGNDEHTLVYAYDGLQRVKSATRYPGTATSGTPQRSDSYTFDVASNRLSQAVALNGGSPTTTNYTYDVANRLSSAGYSYDNAGRLTGDGANSYTWDRANRLLSMGGVSYSYDGAGRRVSQTVSGTTTNYTLDVGMRLWETLVETTGANTTRYVHSMDGLLSQQRPDASWQWALGDGLGSVRGVVNSSLSPQDSRLYTPYGETSQLSGTAQSSYGFTGEPKDSNDLLYLRGRYYRPSIGQFVSLDPLETANRYGYVGGNVVNRVDPTGLYEEGGKPSDTYRRRQEAQRQRNALNNANPNPGGNAGGFPTRSNRSVTPWAWNANPNPQPNAPTSQVTVFGPPSETPPSGWAWNANPNPQPSAPISQITVFNYTGKPAKPLNNKSTQRASLTCTLNEYFANGGQCPDSDPTAVSCPGFSASDWTDNTGRFGWTINGSQIADTNSQLIGVTYYDPSNRSVSSASISTPCFVDELRVRVRRWQAQDPTQGGEGANPCKEQLESKCTNCNITSLQVPFENFGVTSGNTQGSFYYILVVEHAARSRYSWTYTYTYYSDVTAYNSTDNQSSAAFQGSIVYNGRVTNLTDNDTGDGCPLKFPL